MPRDNEIHLTELDAARLERAIIAQLRREDVASQGAVELEAILDSAAVVPSASIEPQVVTMNSTVVVEEPESRTRTTYTLVYPKDADPECSRISVLSPVGRALIGARVGETIENVVPDHPSRRLVVAELSYQPEASGHFDV